MSLYKYDAASHFLVFLCVCFKLNVIDPFFKVVIIMCFYRLTLNNAALKELLFKSSVVLYFVLCYVAPGRDSKEFAGGV